MIIDTDTGVDDAMGVVYGLLAPELDVVALTTVFGNMSTDITTENTLRLLEEVGATSTPVHRGAEKGLLGRPTFNPEVHGADGVGDAGFPPATIATAEDHAALAIIEAAHRHPGEVTFVGLGPLTNLALALALDPTVADSLAGVVWMGGVVSTPGNVGPVIEADAAHDPEAAQMVFEAEWRTPLVMVGLDVTDDTLFTRADLVRVAAADSPTARYVAAIAPFYMRFYEPLVGQYACAMHSPLATAIAALPDLATRSVTAVASMSLAPGVTRGMTVLDRRPGQGTEARTWATGQPVSAVLDVDRDRFKSIYLDTICGQAVRARRA